MKLRLTYDRAYAVFEGPDAADEGETLRSFLTFEGATYDSQAQRRVPFFLPMYEASTMSFPIGYAPLVVEAFKEQGLEVSVDTSERKRPSPPDESTLDRFMPSREPRDYQRAAALIGIQRGVCLIRLGTAAGKTLITVGIREVGGSDLNWVLFAPNDTLAHQLVDEFKEALDEKVGYITSRGFKPAKTTVITLPQARAKWDRVRPILEEADGVVADEAHVMACMTGLSVMKACKNAFYRIGLSATPLDRSDEASIHVVGLFGPIGYEVPTKLLIERGYIADTEVNFLRHDHLVPRHYAQPDEAYRDRIVMNQARNALILKAVQVARKPAMLFLLREEHVMGFHKKLTAMGYKTAFVTQRVGTRERDRIRKAANDGDLDVIVAGNVFSTGVNIPNLRSVIVGTGYKSTIAALQRLGRGGRVTEDKDTFEFWDIADYGEFGQRHTAARSAAYRREGYKIKLHTQGDIDARIAALAA
jgi:superfamily II DNA or RNA helicase